MIDERDLLERAGQRVAPPEQVMDGLYRRRDHKQRIRRISALVLGLAITIASIAGLVAAFRHAKERMPAHPSITVNDVRALQEVGLTPTNGAAFRLASDGDVLVVGTGQFKTNDVSGSLSAFRLPCGGDVGVCHALWTARTDGAALPAIADGVVYAIGLRGHTLYAFDIGCAVDGSACAPRWTGRLNGEVGSSRAPVVQNGKVYVGTALGLMAFPTVCSNPCQALWESPTDRAVRAIATAGNIVFAGTGASGAPDGLDRGSIYAFRADRPARAVWHQSVGQVWDLAVDGGRLFVGTNGHSQGVKTYAVSCAKNARGTCKPLWTASTACCTQLVATGGLVLAHDHVSSVYEFPQDCRSDGNGCAATWTSSVLPPSDPYVDFDSPTVSGGVAFVGGEAGPIYAYPLACADPCKAVWHGLGATASGDAVALNDRLYVATTEGLHVFTPRAAPTTSSTPKGNAARFYSALLLVGLGVLVVALVRKRRAADSRWERMRDGSSTEANHPKRTAP